MKGLIIAAGYGTRFLPATKTVPKEMLPLITKPTISFIVEEFIASGIRDIVVVTSRRKKSLEDFLDREVELEEVFRREGAENKLEKIQPHEANFTFVRQQEMRGTGDAFLHAEPFIGEEPFVVAYPDDIHFGETPLARQLIDVYEKNGMSVLATLHDPPEINRYGVLDFDPEDGFVSGIVEKPPKGEETSKEASIGRFLFTPEIFSHLREGWKAHTGEEEFYHTYGIQELIKKKKVVHHSVEGTRLDVGTPEGYLEALLSYASSDPSLKEIIDKFKTED